MNQNPLPFPPPVPAAIQRPNLWDRVLGVYNGLLLRIFTGPLLGTYIFSAIQKAKHHRK